MARLRKIEIRNFRGIRSLEWCPSRGINCLIGRGDSGKSTILDAIDLCIGGRRNPHLGDADFHLLDCGRPISILATVGDLDPALLSFEAYGLFLRGFDAATGTVEDEPGSGLDTVITVELKVEADLEPRWSLASDRAARLEIERSLSWADRLRIAPTRLSGAGSYNLGWTRGSILHRLSDERVDTSAVITQAAREARAAFGRDSGGQLDGALASVQELTERLGIPVGSGVTAMLDPRSLDLGSGTVSLHDFGGVPLQGLGLGSSRLLVVGMQRMAASTSSMILIDEVEHGLEPHRILRLLSELGSREKDPPLQAFVTTHSPVVVKELSVEQLHVVRRTSEGDLSVKSISSAGDVQGTVRSSPDALLSRSVLVCEGATEVGFMRGVDRHRVERGVNRRGIRPLFLG